MIQYRDGVIWFASVPAFLEERNNIRQLALAIESDQTPPPLRAKLAFDAIVEGTRCGPLQGEVVHLAGRVIGLQLDPASSTKLLQLADRLAGIGRHERLMTMPVPIPGGPKKVSASPAAEDKMASESIPTATNDLKASGSMPTLSSADGVAEISGQLAGPIGLGALNYLLATETVDALQPTTSLIRLLCYLQQQRATGECVVRGSGYNKTIWFKRGVPIRVVTKPFKEEEQLGQLLLKAQIVSPHRLGEAIRHARSRNLALGAALVQSGLLDEPMLARSLTHQNYYRLRDLFDWPQATYTFAKAELPPEPYFPVPVSRLLGEMGRELLHTAKWEFVEFLVQPYMHRFPVLATISEDRLRQIVEKDKAIKVCQQLFDGKRALRQVLRASLLGRRDTARLVLILIAAGALHLQIDALDPAITPERKMDERVRTLQIEDPFQRLALTYSAHAADIQDAYLKYVAEYQAGTPLAVTHPKAAATAGQMIKEAHDLLATATARKNCRDRLLKADVQVFLADALKQQALFATLHGDSALAAKLEETWAELTG